MIGVFDSGIGGLTVVRALRQLDPKLDILYLGDTARLPYGTKSPATIQRYAIEDARYLINAGARVLVVACNTMSAVAVETLRAEFPNIPLFEVITPAVTAALAVGGRIGVIGTRATIASGIYERLIQSNVSASRRSQIPALSHVEGSNVVSKACPLFVPLVEEGWAKKSATKRIAKHYLQSLKTQGLDALILGCTHYPFLSDVIQQVVGRRVKLIDPADVTAQAVILALQNNPDLYKLCHNNGQLTVCLTDKTPHITALAQQWLDLPNLQTKLINLTAG